MAEYRSYRWEGTKAEYDALTKINPNVKYFIKDLQIIMVNGKEYLPNRGN